jgi:LuxR family maltose regulon positive regulatory protein
VPLDDERIWYRYHQLFADLLRAQLQRSLGAQGVAQLHVRASEWHGQNGSILEAIHHASMASDDERVERLIEQHYMEMVSRGEMSGMRFWAGKLSKELVYRRPWLCIYEAYSHAWFGELDEADLLLEEAEKRIRSEISAPDGHSTQGLLAYVKSRVTAMRGDIQRAIEFCLAAREHIPAGNLALQWDTRVTLGYEYFLSGDYANASQILNEAIRSGITAGAIIHTVAASCMMARLVTIQGLLNKSYDMYQTAAQLIPEASGHLDARALVEVGIADVLCERNDLEAALVHISKGLALPISLWRAFIWLRRTRVTH